MSEESKPLGFEWYDVKTKFKKIIRSIFYTDLIQNLFCLIVVFYIRLVYLTSKKIMVGDDKLTGLATKQKPFIIALWHSRIMISPFIITKKVYKVEKQRHFYSLSSKHGDGKIVGKVMEKFGLINIYGSSRDGRKTSRGIDIQNFRKIFKVLKSEIGVAITPDGPRGPKQKVGGQIIKIAALTSSPIIPLSCGYSRYIKINSWDQFRIPLPFGTICYYCDDLIKIDKKITDKDVEKMNLLLEEKINLATKKADEISLRGYN